MCRNGNVFDEKTELDEAIQTLTDHASNIMAGRMPHVLALVTYNSSLLTRALQSILPKVPHMQWSPVLHTPECVDSQKSTSAQVSSATCCFEALGRDLTT